MKSEKKEKQNKKLIIDLEGDIDSYIIVDASRILVGYLHLYKKITSDDSNFSMSQNILPLG